MRRFGLCIAVMCLAALGVGCETTGGNGEVVQGGDAASHVVPAAANPVLVTMQTSMGDIVLELDPDKAPISCENFLQYAESGYYDNTVFHRVVENHVVQGGTYLSSLRKKDGLRDPIPNESGNGLANMRGTIAMARDIASESAQAEFFFNVTDNAGRLDFKPGERGGYAVFGRVTKGLSVIDKMAASQVGGHARYGAGRVEVVPVKPITITSARMDNPSQQDRVILLASEKRRLLEHRAKMGDQSEAQWRAEFVRATEESYGMEFIDHPNGYSFIDLRKGLGPSTFDNGSVQFSYVGKLVKGLNVIEDNRGAEFPKWLELNKLISGLRMALSGMQVGGKRLVILPPDLAFGADGMPRGNNPIPPNSSIIYELELLDVKPPEE